MGGPSDATPCSPSKHRVESFLSPETCGQCLSGKERLTGLKNCGTTTRQLPTSRILQVASEPVLNTSVCTPVLLSGSKGFTVPHPSAKLNYYGNSRSL